MASSQTLALVFLENLYSGKVTPPLKTTLLEGVRIIIGPQFFPYLACAFCKFFLQKLAKFGGCSCSKKTLPPIEGHNPEFQLIPSERWVLQCTSYMGKLQTLSVTFTLRTSVKDVRGHSDKASCRVIIFTFSPFIFAPPPLSNLLIRDKKCFARITNIATNHI